MTNLSFSDVDSSFKGYCRELGKDRVIILPEEELSKESKIELSEPKEEDMEPGLVLPNGEINWNCPCLGGMASGPCGFQFREAFSCFHNSQSEAKGADCVDKFSLLQECMASYPNLYPGKRSEEGIMDEKGVQ